MTTDLDARTRQYGREIFARLDRQGPVLFTRPWFEDRLMGLGTHDPALLDVPAPNAFGAELWHGRRKIADVPPTVIHRQLGPQVGLFGA